MGEYRSHADSVSSCKYRHSVLDVVEADMRELFGETADHFRPVSYP